MTNDAFLDSLQLLVTIGLAEAQRLRFIDVAGVLAIIYVSVQIVQAISLRMKMTALRGPPSPSFLLGVDKVLSSSPGESGGQFERWAEEYGMVYQVPWGMGGKKIVLCDPKAIAHVCARDPWTYTLIPLIRTASSTTLGNQILSATGECHRRRRKILDPGFTNAAIRNLMPVFYDSARKVRSAWDSLIESSDDGNAVIEIQNWMNCISLDTIGIAAFSHDFGALQGKPSSIKEMFDTIGREGRPPRSVIPSIIWVFPPWFLKLSLPYAKFVKRMNYAMSEISNVLLENSRKEKEANTFDEWQERSIFSRLIKAKKQEGQGCLTQEEMASEAKAILLAGVETISLSLTWTLIELSKNLDIQTKLRTELLEFGGVDPTFGQLSGDLPYLDAVVHETLRMHPAIHENLRIATTDDIIPLSKPVCTPSGKWVDHVSVAKGTYLYIPMMSLNCSAALWGPDAKVFRPERWIVSDGIPKAAREMRGHRHLLTFFDGPRACIGKGFALAKMKTVLFILVKHFVFELRDGPESKIETMLGLLLRPRLAGEKGIDVPLRVRRVE